jgi:hypothetical protein
MQRFFIVVKKREQGTRLSEARRPFGQQRQALNREAAHARSGVIQEQEDADDERGFRRFGAQRQK